VHGCTGAAKHMDVRERPPYSANNKKGCPLGWPFLLFDRVLNPIKRLFWIPACAGMTLK
jgi:hypothetical protein